MLNPPIARASSLGAVLRVALALPLLAAVVPGEAAAQVSAAQLDGNEWTCTLWHEHVCDSQGVGEWPLPFQQYVYQGGLQAAGIVAEDAGFAWAGEYASSRFYDPRGTSENGRLVAGYFDSTRPADVAAWPSAGQVPGFPFLSASPADSELFHPMYAMGPAVSEQDVWAAMWDGGSRGETPAYFGNGRRLGIVVEQRAMVWNHPYGNQATIYLAYEIHNVTNDSLFRRNVAHGAFEGDLGAVPAGGWRIDSLYVGFDLDADVTTDATDNHGSALPWARAVVAWDEDLADSQFDYPANIFHPPFRPASPGFVATALVYAEQEQSSLIATDLAMSSAHSISCGPASLCHSLGDEELWRFLSGRFGPLADRCEVADPETRRFCDNVVSGDVVIYQSVGPYSLEPGESITVVYALIAAPVLDVPEFQPFTAPPLPTLAPGCAGEAASALDLAAGWAGVDGCPPPGALPDPASFDAVTGSLLHRIQIARAFAANRFVVPLAPEAPEFHLLPGDSAVHIVWARSATEQGQSGDPFHDVASDSTSALYNPNYRRHDVEGYRIYRSTDRVNWRLIAQLDYDSTTFVDSLCETDRDHAAGEPCTEIREVPIYDGFYFDEVLVQYRPGDIVRSAGGQPIRLGGDTASAGYHPLGDIGVPYVFVDGDVRAGYRYYYQVRAFDVNSYRSGPSSLESESQTRSVVVQPQFATLVEPTLEARLVDAAGDALDPSAPMPAIDAETGVFDGPMPPTNALSLQMLPDIDRFLGTFRLDLRIDSVRLGPTPVAPCTNGVDQLGACWRLFYTVALDDGQTVAWADGYTPLWDAFGGPGRVEWNIMSTEVPADSATLAAAHALPELLTYRAQVSAELDESIFNSANEGQLNRRAGGSGIPSTVIAGGSRWFDGTAETVADPTRFIRVGHLNGVDTVWAPIHHTDVGDGSTYPASGTMQCFGYVVSGIARVADLSVTWQDGTITVEDVTHGVPVPFKPTVQQSWGFVRDANGNGLIDWQDFDYVDGVAPLIRLNNFCAQPPPGSETQLSRTPVIAQVSTDGVASGFGAAGSGFGLYINAQRFIFETNGALPANGTVWTLRNYHGYVTASSGAATANPSGYQFLPASSGGLVELRPPMVPGLSAVFEGTAARFEGAADLARIHAVPDPYYFHSSFGPEDRGRLIRFVNLPPQATIRIYSVAGILVDVIHHDDPASGIATWDLQTRDGVGAASGVYFFHVVAPGAEEHLGRFTIVTSGRYVD